jgi:hypothetical protein
MKKLGMLALAAVLVAMFTVPAWAIESQFGGYWRTRFYQQRNYSGSDNPDDNRSDDQDWTGVDTRTRLYYTAIFSDNLKFENRFEFNVTWGDGNGGDIGADGTAIFRIKHSYINAWTGPVNWKVGIQGWSMARGFLFDDDASGISANYKGEMFEIPLYWIHAFEGDSTTSDENDQDADYYGIFPKFSIGDMFKVNPYFLYIYSKDAQGWARLQYPELGGLADDYKSWYLGIDADADLGPGSAWLTFIYQGGSVGTNTPSGESFDFGGWLGALGGAFDIGIFDIHGQAFYATGDKDSGDNDLEAFSVTQGRSY